MKYITMLNMLTVLLIFICQCLHSGMCQDDGLSKTSFEDARCKCVCPKFKKDNSSDLTQKTVYISANADPNNCNCPFVVNSQYCSMCECKYENRNTTTIKVVVIIIICVTSLLLVYMMFLLCLDPLIVRRPGTYQEHMDEDDQSVSQVPQFEGGARPRLKNQKSVINYVSDEQKRWKSTVQEQRRNIYDKHTMLN